MKIIKNILKGISIIILMGIIGYYGISIFKDSKKIKYSSKNNPQLKIIEVDKSGKIFEEKIKELQDEVLNKLDNCESPNTKEEDALIVWDDNSKGTLPYSEKPSIGEFQFKKGTVQYYYKKLYGKDITKLQATLIALDYEKSRDLARDVIFEVQGGIFNWYNCERKNSLTKEVTIIKKIMN